MDEELCIEYLLQELGEAEALDAKEYQVWVLSSAFPQSGA